MKNIGYTYSFQERARYSRFLWAWAGVLTLTLTLGQSAHAQTFSILHAFNGSDGAHLYGGLTIDRVGNLYGTAAQGGTRGCSDHDIYPEGCGVSFRLSKSGPSWLYTVLYDFDDYDFEQSGEDGAHPGTMRLGPDGILYGSTFDGGVGCIDGGSNGCGTVYELRPTHASCGAATCPWAEKVLYRFNKSDGALPFGDLA